MLQLANYRWRRDVNNPILPPDPGSAFDSRSCMNPNIIRVGDEYRLYYSGGDADGHQRICLATASVDAPAHFRRLGPVMELGAAGTFDAHWCVLPFVIRIGDTWHLYYSGRDDTDFGLQSFWGLGLARSDDGLHFTRHATDPMITGNLTKEFPRNRGIAGGSVIAETQADGSTCYRLYYTLSVGVPSDDLAVSQEKHCAVCRSTDGIKWTDHRIILSPRKDFPGEDIAVAGPFVRKVDGGYRMLYSAIGTKWGAYSIGEAVSTDGDHWYRGEAGENITLEPDPARAWESAMVEYPSKIQEGDILRLFYCGNGYGATGIGMATAL